MLKTRVIVLEFNELTPALMYRFMAQGKLPHFSRLFSEADVYTTTAAERAPYLDPWIQWVTVHTGLDHRHHGIQRLNEGHTLTAPRVWDRVSEAGGRVWVCGSMSIGGRPPRDGWVLPDPWTTTVGPYPPGLKPYFSFVQRQVMEHTHPNASSGGLDALRFASFMASHGLSVRTAAALVKHLAEESRGGGRWKRATYLDRIQFDLFAWYYRRMRPHFATFFLNSTAHYQHLYWREMDPDTFVAKPTEKERLEYRHAIEYGYRQMDALVGRVFDLIDESTAVVMATALSQQPCLMFEEHGGKFFYRPIDFRRLTTFAGIAATHTVSPVMAHQFHLYFETEAEAADAARRLGRVRYMDGPALAVEPDGRNVFVGCRVHEPLAPDARLTLREGSGDVPFFELFYRVDGVKSGMHHPDGMFWMRTPARHHQIHSDHVPLAAVAPTLLEWLGIERPAYMCPPVSDWSREGPVAATA